MGESPHVEAPPIPLETAIERDAAIAAAQLLRLARLQTSARRPPDPAPEVLAPPARAVGVPSLDPLREAHPV